MCSVNRVCVCVCLCVDFKTKNASMSTTRSKRDPDDGERIVKYTDDIGGSDHDSNKKTTRTPFRAFVNRDYTNGTAPRFETERIPPQLAGVVSLYLYLSVILYITTIICVSRNTTLIPLLTIMFCMKLVVLVTYTLCSAFLHCMNIVAFASNNIVYFTTI